MIENVERGNFTTYKTLLVFYVAKIKFLFQIVECHFSQ